MKKIFPSLLKVIWYCIMIISQMAAFKAYCPDYFDLYFCLNLGLALIGLSYFSLQYSRVEEERVPRFVHERSRSRNFKRELKEEGKIMEDNLYYSQ